MMYIGQEQVKETKEAGDWITVLFESGRTANYPKVMYDAMLTTDPLDASALRDRRVMKVMQEYVKILIAYDLTFKEVSALTMYVDNFLDEKKQFAQAKVLRPHMINTLPDNAHPAAQLDLLSIGDVDKILKDGGQNNTTGGKS